MNLELLANPEIMNLLFDGVLIVAIGGLWLQWMNVSRRQQQLQTLFVETTRQLDEASSNLESAMQCIERLKKAPPQTETLHREKALPQKPTGSMDSQATRILRMWREGEDEAAIAEKLDIPLAQVRLMLKLHAPARHA